MAHTAPEPLIVLRRSIAKDINTNWLAKCTREAWRATRNGEHTKSFLTEVNPNLSIKLVNMSKKEIRIAIGLITGHCKVNNHLVKLRLRDDPDCDLCGRDRETAEHLLCKCEALSNIRLGLYGRASIDAKDLLKDSLQKLIYFYELCSARHTRMKRIF